MAGIAYDILVAPPVWLVQTLLIEPVSYVLYCVTLPPRAFLGFVFYFVGLLVNFIRSLEFLFIFVGTAIVVGAVAGGSLHRFSRGFASMLGADVDGEDQAEPAPAARTLADYRKTREIRKLESALTSVDLSTVPFLDYATKAQQRVTRAVLEDADEDSDM